MTLVEKVVDSTKATHSGKHAGWFSICTQPAKETGQHDNNSGTN